MYSLTMPESISIDSPQVIGGANRAVRIYNMNIVGTGVVGGTLVADPVVTLLKTVIDGDPLISETGVSIGGVTKHYDSVGLYFPDGCWITLSSTVSTAYVTYIHGPRQDGV